MPFIYNFSDISINRNHLTGVQSISEMSSVISSLKMTGLKPSLQLQIATPGLRIQSP